MMLTITDVFCCDPNPITVAHIPAAHQPHITLKYVLSVLWFISQAHMTLGCELNHYACKKIRPRASHRAKGFIGQLRYTSPIRNISDI